MSASPTITTDDDVDREADEQISACLKLGCPQSFFLFAGAGSGKTRSLVKALNRFCDENGKNLRLRGQRVGVITYTNAACDEIKRRLDFDPSVEVRTIHSFVWLLIGGLHTDIKVWVEANLKIEIAELEDLQRRGRAASQAARDRVTSIESKQKRLANLVTIKQFTYDPNGENRGKESLNHSEVIKIGAEFLTTKPLMQSLLVNRFPILLIDESQDTNKHLMEAFLTVQEKQAHRFGLGLLGDTMQRIYNDGKENLGQNLPANWAKPAKKMNHRCPRRVIRLINKIRAEVDGQEQHPRSDKEEGAVRLFILPSGIADKPGAERNASQKMAAITGDPLWSGADAIVKTLILEHHMAARRMGFLEMFAPLYEEEGLRIGLLDGSLPGLRLFSQLILPLVRAKQRGDQFAAATIVRRGSPLISKAAFRAAGANQIAQIAKAREATDELMKLWSDNGKPTFLDVLRCVARTRLFEIPESLSTIASRSDIEQDLAGAIDQILSPDDLPDSRLAAWDKFLATPFGQIEPYTAYVSGTAAFDTHQGVKGLEFPRVMVVMDDEEARGFLFSYDKLFGAKEKTKTDRENERDGKDSGPDRTRRLFYVTCSRAVKSLALVAYSNDPDKVRAGVIASGWFEEGEVELVS